MARLTRCRAFARSCPIIRKIGYSNDSPSVSDNPLYSCLAFQRKAGRLKTISSLSRRLFPDSSETWRAVSMHSAIARSANRGSLDLYWRYSRVEVDAERSGHSRSLSGISPVAHWLLGDVPLHFFYAAAIRSRKEDTYNTLAHSEKWS